MSNRTALAIAVGATVVLTLVKLFQIDWILGTAGLMVVPGTLFVFSAFYLESKTEGVQAAVQAARLRAVGYLLVGVGALFGMLMYLEF